MASTSMPWVLWVHDLLACMGGDHRMSVGRTATARMGLPPAPLQEERRRVKELQDECYQRLRETQKLSRSKANDYYDNRRFSQKVCSSPGHLSTSRSLLPDSGNEAC